MTPTKTVVYCYQNTLYNPSSAEIRPDILANEETHTRQQGDKPDAWWDSYLEDSMFRMNQESEAYGNQYRFICKLVKDREHRNKILFELAAHLSGPIYGNALTLPQAYQLIKKLANVK